MITVLKNKAPPHPSSHWPPPPNFHLCTLPPLVKPHVECSGTQRAAEGKTCMRLFTCKRRAMGPIVKTGSSGDSSSNTGGCVLNPVLMLTFHHKTPFFKASSQLWLYCSVFPRSVPKSQMLQFSSWILFDFATVTQLKQIE